MIYKEYKLLASYTALKQELELYPNFLKYINHRLDELELKYSPDNFTNYFLALLAQEHFYLTNCEAEFNFITTWTLDDFSATTTTKGTSTGTMTNDNTTSYTGYNVSGDYQKGNASGQSTNINTGTSSTFEKFTAMVRTNMTPIQKAWDHIIGNIISDLFINSYAII